MLSLESPSWGTVYPGTCPVPSVPQARSFPFPPGPSLPLPALGLSAQTSTEAFGSNTGPVTGSLHSCMAAVSLSESQHPLL